jgi:polyisoprenyl-phosphate glycosyltransferase
MHEGEEGRVDVSVVLPVHDEAGHLDAELDRIHAALAASEFTYEIIVVDDASTDGSTEVARQRVDIRLIELPVNRGSGFSRRVGSQAAHGDVVVWTDVDMTYPNDEIPALVRQLGRYDQVVGARTSEQGTHRWARVPAKRAIRGLASYLVEEPIPDLNSGFRAFRRDVLSAYLHLLPNGFSCVTTITLAFMANGYSVHYVPIEYAERAGRSKFHWRRDTSRYVLQVIRMVMTFNPLRVFLPLGGLLLLLALVKLGYDVIDKDWRITSNAIILVIVSLQVLATGLLADLVARVGMGRGTGPAKRYPERARPAPPVETPRAS